MRRLDEISISRMRVHCIVGIYPGERGTPQPIEVELSLFFERTEPAAQGLVDYARVFGDVSFLLESCRFRTLETAAEAICRYLLAPPPIDTVGARVEGVALTLQKPEALKGVALAALKVRRRRRDYDYPRTETAFGVVEVLHDGEGVQLLRVNVRPGQHYASEGDACHLLLGAGFSIQGKPQLRGTAQVWVKGSLPHLNGASTSRALLVVPTHHSVLLSRKQYYPPEDAALAEDA